MALKITTTTTALSAESPLRDLYKAGALLDRQTK